MVARLLLATLRHVAELLNREQFSWALAGGLALSVWDHPRFTKDSDFLVDVQDRDINVVLSSFQSAGLQPKRYPPIITVGNQRFAQFLFKPEDTDFEIQVDFIFAEQDYHRRALSRRVPANFSEWGVATYALSCEDLIIFKLVSGRIIDIADAAALLRINHDLIDFSLLSRECNTLEVVEDLARIWNEVFPNTTLPGADG